MKTIKDYLDDLKSKTGSDYKSALMLEMDRSVIANIRKRNLISDETALKVAEVLKIDPGEVLLAAAMARSNGAVKTAWESVSKRAGIAASVALAMMLIFQPGNEAVKFSNNIHYANLIKRRRVFCVRTISIIMESIKWHVKKAVFTIPVQRYA